MPARLLDFGPASVRFSQNNYKHSEKKEHKPEVLFTPNELKTAFKPAPQDFGEAWYNVNRVR